MANAVKKLEEVKSEIANLEGKLLQAESRLSLEQAAHENTLRALSKANERKAVMRDDRALYVNLDGTTRNAAPYYDGRCDGPAREVNLDELQPGGWITVNKFSQYTPVESRRRRYRLVFSQGSLHVYQEV